MPRNSRQSTVRDDLTRILFASMVLVINKGQKPMNMRIQHWTPEALRRAADIVEEIRKLNDEFDSILVGEPQHQHELFHAPKPPKPPFQFIGSKPKRKMSAEARARIGAAMKKRWRKARAAGKLHL